MSKSEKIIEQQYTIDTLDAGASLDQSTIKELQKENDQLSQNFYDVNIAMLAMEKENKQMKDWLLKVYRDASFDEINPNTFNRFVEKIIPEEFCQESIKQFEKMGL